MVSYGVVWLWCEREGKGGQEWEGGEDNKSKRIRNAAALIGPRLNAPYVNPLPWGASLKWPFLPTSQSYAA